jgi:hypothetical protein
MIRDDIPGDAREGRDMGSKLVGRHAQMFPRSEMARKRLPTVAGFILLNTLGAAHGRDVVPRRDRSISEPLVTM